MIPKDDMNMIGAYALGNLLKLEKDSRAYYNYLADIEEREPRMYAWVERGRQEDIVALSQQFEDLFTAYPTLPLYINGLLLKSFIRGYNVAESKWQDVIIAPDEPRGLYSDENGDDDLGFDFYYPEEKDFD